LSAGTKLTVTRFVKLRTPRLPQGALGEWRLLSFDLVAVRTPV
jgi:hypothetical protein